MAKAATKEAPVLALIRDRSALERAVSAFKGQSEKFHNTMHVLACSVLCHAAEHGDTALLNKFYSESLPGAYQATFRVFINKVQSTNTAKGGLGVGDVLGFEKGLFFVNKGKSKEREHFVQLLETDLLTGAPFFTYNPIALDRIFNNAAVGARLDALIKQAAKASEDPEHVQVSGDVLKILLEARKEVERVASLPMSDALVTMYEGVKGQKSTVPTAH